MTLIEAVQNYVDAKAAYDAEEADIINTEQVAIPQAKADISSAETGLHTAELSLRQATTSAAVQTAREALSAAEQAVKDAVQLKDNLEAKVKAFRVHQSTKQAAVAYAAREMWLLKREELMAQFAIPAPEFALLEQIIAAGDGAKDGWGNPVIGDVVNEKHGRTLDRDRINTVKAALLSDLVALLP